jgi:hypothetical protein
MLARVTSAFGLAVVMTAALLALARSAAQADGHGGGTDPFGGVSCRQAYAPSCTVAAGTPGSGGQPAGKPASPLAVVGPGGCARSQFGCVPPGCNLTQNTLACPLGIPSAGGGPGVPPPGVLGQVARRLLVLPSPVIRSSPAPGDLQLVHLPVWLWVDRAVWVPRSRTAVVPGEEVTATAVPVSVLWRMGDGSVVTCRGPGIPYSRRYSPPSASPDCGHTYGRSSAGQPRGAYRVAATITWDVTWQATGGAGGTLPPLFSRSAAAFRVAESQAVNTAGGSR